MEDSTLRPEEEKRFKYTMQTLSKKLEAKKILFSVMGVKRERQRVSHPYA